MDIINEIVHTMFPKLNTKCLKNVQMQCENANKASIRSMFCFFFCIMLIVPRFLWQNEVIKSDPLERDACSLEEMRKSCQFYFFKGLSTT